MVLTAAVAMPLAVGLTPATAHATPRLAIPAEAIECLADLRAE